MIQTRVYFESMMTEMKIRLETANNKLKQRPLGKLNRLKRGKKTVFYHSIRTNGHRRRLAITSNKACLAALANKGYLEKEIYILEKDIKALEDFLKKYVEPCADDIIAQLPERYISPEITSEMLVLGVVPELSTSLANAANTTSILNTANTIDALNMINATNISNRTNTTDISNTANTQNLKWSEQPYKQSTYNPEGKKHTTSRGLKVRSKSEVLIAEKLYELGLEFRYEQVIQIGEYEVVPDFIIKKPKKNPWDNEPDVFFYLEHCGMTGNPQYMKHHKWKMEEYESVGIVPWKNLIVTYEDEEGNLNMAVIESELRSKIINA